MSEDLAGLMTIHADHLLSNATAAKIGRAWLDGLASSGLLVGLKLVVTDDNDLASSPAVFFVFGNILAFFMAAWSIGVPAIQPLVRHRQAALLGWAVVGLLLGAGAMYVFDPAVNRGAVVAVAAGGLGALGLFIWLRRRRIVGRGIWTGRRNAA